MSGFLLGLIIGYIGGRWVVEPVIRWLLRKLLAL